MAWLSFFYAKFNQSFKKSVPTSKQYWMLPICLLKPEWSIKSAIYIQNIVAIKGKKNPAIFLQQVFYDSLVCEFYMHSLLTFSPPRVFWRVKLSGIRQSKIYKWPLVVKALREIVFLTLSPPRVSLWRVKSSGVRQSKIYKWPLVVKGLNFIVME